MTPVAEIRDVRGKYVRVSCPWRQGSHAHDRTVAGSSEVLAPCHRPRTALRTYSIPSLSRRQRKERP